MCVLWVWVFLVKELSDGKLVARLDMVNCICRGNEQYGGRAEYLYLKFATQTHRHLSIMTFTLGLDAEGMISRRCEDEPYEMNG